MIRFGIITASLVGALAFALPANAATITFTATLDGASERPDAVATNGTGSATVTLDDVADTVSWNITYQNLSSSVISAHFHGPADAGTAAGVRIPIPVADGGTSPITGSAAITEPQQAELLDGLWYINIHTQMFQGGEIRGQVLRQQTDGGTDGGDAAPDAQTDGSTDARADGDATTDARSDADSAGGTAGTAGSAGRGGTAGSAGTSGTGGSAGRGGTSGASGTGGTGTAGRGGTSGRGGTGGSSAPPADDDDGCGCRTVGDSGSAAGLIGLALGGLMLSRRMAERRARREKASK